MDDRMQRISFAVASYATTSALWASVAALLKVLHETDYIAVVFADALYVHVDFNPNDESGLIAQPYWLYGDEFEQITFDDEEDKDLEI